VVVTLGLRFEGEIEKVDVSMSAPAFPGWQLMGDTFRLMSDACLESAKEADRRYGEAWGSTAS
jgi:hypothetical protein